jgi:hypothetical protein
MQILVSRRARVCAIAFTAVLAWAPASIYATQGDCAQPVTNGSSPTASDCLFILRAAVGSETCDPACICAPKGSLPTTATDALVCLKKAVGQPVMLSCPCQAQAGDDFNDNSKDPAKWGPDIVYGHGTLKETSQVLEYTCSSGTADDESLRPWYASDVPFDADWEAQIDLANFTALSGNNQVDSFGIYIADANNYDNAFYGELYVSHLGGPPTRKGFYGELLQNGSYVSEVDSGDLGVTTGAVRLAFDAGTKVATLFYDVDSSNGHAWVQYGSFGLAGSGGANGNTDWGLANGARMVVAVYGYSSNMVVKSGKMNGDNFQVTGGVAP